METNHIQRNSNVDDIASKIKFLIMFELQRQWFQFNHVNIYRATETVTASLNCPILFNTKRMTFD